MANIVVVNSQTALENYATSTEILYWTDPMQGGVFSYASSGFTVDNGIAFAAPYIGTGTGSWVRQYEGDILPQWFKIKNDGSAITLPVLDAWMTACKTFNKVVFLPEGTYCFPVNFQKDFGNFNLVIKGIKNKTTITTLLNDTDDTRAYTNFAVPSKLDITKAKPVDGVYQIDITGPVIHSDFSPLTSTALGSYLKVAGGVVSSLTFTNIKDMGYVTELELTATPTEPGKDGLYVVSKHIAYSYGGGFAHLNLKYANGVSGTLSGFNTGTNNAFYVQGTVLKRDSGVWGRYYSGAGFGTTGSLTVMDIIFDNVRFYLFSPFDITAFSAPQTSDIFSISGCVFKNCHRIISSISYGGIDQDPAGTWFETQRVYEGAGRFRFLNFSITDNEFSYIHQSLCWGAPPSLRTIISGNNLHDCYTIVATFNLLMLELADHTYWLRRITQTLTNNSFINMRPLNAGANGTLCLIRTTGAAVVNDNSFLDFTQQAIYISGSNSTFNGNTVTKFCDDDIAYLEYPIMLVKLINDQSVVEISGNNIIAPLNSLVEMEGDASFTITGNSYVGFAKSRYITRITTQINPARIYCVRDTGKFQSLAGAGNYDNSTDPTYEIVLGSYVYFNKRRNIWVKLQIPSNALPNTYVFSKADATDSKYQHVTIEGNSLIESEYITAVGSKTTPITFRSISVINNTIRFLGVLHICNNSQLDEYIFSGNYLRSSSVSLSSTSSLTNQVKSMFFENNKIAKTLGVISLWAYQDLIFKNNVFFPDEDFGSVGVYEDLGVPITPNVVPPYLDGVVLKGATNSKITVDGNHFLNIHSRVNALLLDNPYIADVKNNTFDLNIPTALISTLIGYRTAVKINVNGTVNSLFFRNNTIHRDALRKTYVLECDTTGTAPSGTISSLLVEHNKAIINTGDLTLSAGFKNVTVYFKGVNFYAAYYDSTYNTVIPTAPL